MILFLRNSRTNVIMLARLSLSALALFQTLRAAVPVPVPIRCSADSAFGANMDNAEIDRLAEESSYVQNGT